MSCEPECNHLGPILLLKEHKTMKNLLAIAVATIAFFTISVSALEQAQTSDKGANSATTQATPCPSPNAESSAVPPELKKRVKDAAETYGTYSNRWSGVYWGSVFGAAVFSALSGIFLKLDALKDKRI